MERHLKEFSVDWMEVELGQDFPFLTAVPIGSKPFHSQSTSDPYVQKECTSSFSCSTFATLPLLPHAKDTLVSHNPHINHLQ